MPLLVWRPSLLSGQVFHGTITFSAPAPLLGFQLSGFLETRVVDWGSLCVANSTSFEGSTLFVERTENRTGPLLLGDGTVRCLSLCVILYSYLR